VNNPLQFFDKLQVVRESELDQYEKALLHYLVTRVDKNCHQTYVCVRTMVIDTSMPKSTLQVRLKSLIAKGWIHRQNRPNKSSLTILNIAKFRDALLHSRKAKRMQLQRAASGSLNGYNAAVDRPAAGQPEVTGSPQSASLSADLSEEASVGQETVPKALTPTDFFSELLKTSQKEYPNLQERQFRWMVTQIQARAKVTPRRSTAYWAKCIRLAITEFETEVAEYLFREAKQLLAAGEPDGAVYEHLKSINVENVLLRNLSQIRGAIDRANIALRERT
jgi:hypothetical protein